MASTTDAVVSARALSRLRYPRPELCHCPAKGSWVLQRASEDNPTLYAGNHIFGERHGRNLVVAGPRQRIGDSINPAPEVAPHRPGKLVTRCIPKRQHTDEAHPSSRAEVTINRIKHHRHSCFRGFRLSQWLEHVSFEPGINLCKHGDQHLLFPAREKVIKAAFAQASRLADERQASALISLLSKQFGERRESVRSLSCRSGQLTSRCRLGLDNRPAGVQAAIEIGGQPRRSAGH